MLAEKPANLQCRGIWIQIARRGASLVSHVFAAVIGTAILENSFAGYTASRAAVLKADFINAALALALGFFVYLTRPRAAPKWTWVVGVSWFIWGVFLFARGRLHGTIFWELSWYDADFDVQNPSNDFYSWHSFENWGTYTLPLLRTVFYSVGAYGAAIVKHYHSAVSAPRWPSKPEEKE
jgi:hypothetical protein